MSEHAPLREVDVWGKQLCSCGERYPCATVILTDLIAELRDTAAVKPGATGRLLMEIAGSAETRLREVQGE